MTMAEPSCAHLQFDVASFCKIKTHLPSHWVISQEVGAEIAAQPTVN